VGEGRVGKLPQPQPLREFAQAVGKALGGPLQVVGDPEHEVARVALACGAAGQFLTDAARAGADVFLTGEMRFHDYLQAQAQGVALLLPGHYATERCGVLELARLLGQEWPELEVWASRRERDPVTWVL
jgi:putative NIF3 family GTP cyclohydrolase 1 type 2